MLSYRENSGSVFAQSTVAYGPVCLLYILQSKEQKQQPWLTVTATERCPSIGSTILAFMGIGKCRFDSSRISPLFLLTYDFTLVFKKPLALFSQKPMTGFYRDGYCRVGPEDKGNHAVAGALHPMADPLPLLPTSPSRCQLQSLTPHTLQLSSPTPSSTSRPPEATICAPSDSPTAANGAFAPRAGKKPW